MKKKMLMSAVLVGSLMAVPAFAAENLSDTTEGIAQFDGLEAKEAYDFQIVVKSFQSTYWQAALQGMDQAAEELGVTYSAQGPASESDIADQVNMLNSAINGALPYWNPFRLRLMPVFRSSRSIPVSRMRRKDL